MIECQMHHKFRLISEIIPEIMQYSIGIRKKNAVKYFKHFQDLFSGFFSVFKHFHSQGVIQGNNLEVGRGKMKFCPGKAGSCKYKRGTPP